MRTMLTAFIATVVIAVGADVALDRIGWSSAQQGSSSSVRLD